MEVRELEEDLENAALVKNQPDKEWNKPGAEPCQVVENVVVWIKSRTLHKLMILRRKKD